MVLDHTWWCLGLSPGSVLRDYFWWCLGTMCNARNKTGVSNIWDTCLYSCTVSQVSDSMTLEYPSKCCYQDRLISDHSVTLPYNQSQVTITHLSHLHTSGIIFVFFFLFLSLSPQFWKSYDYFISFLAGHSVLWMDHTSPSLDFWVISMVVVVGGQQRGQGSLTPASGGLSAVGLFFPRVCIFP